MQFCIYHAALTSQAQFETTVPLPTNNSTNNYACRAQNLSLLYAQHPATKHNNPLKTTQAKLALPGRKCPDIPRIQIDNHTHMQHLWQMLNKSTHHCSNQSQSRISSGGHQGHCIIHHLDPPEPCKSIPSWTKIISRCKCLSQTVYKLRL